MNNESVISAGKQERQYGAVARVLDDASSTFACITTGQRAVLDACLNTAAKGGKTAIMAAALWTRCNEALKEDDASRLDYWLSRLIALLRDNLHDPRAGLQAYREFDCGKLSGALRSQEEYSKCFAALDRPEVSYSASLVEFGEELLRKAS